MTRRTVGVLSALMVGAVVLTAIVIGHSRAAVPARAARAQPAPQAGPAPQPIAPTSESQGAVPAWTMYQHDAAHTGAVTAQPLLPARPGWTSDVLDGDVYGQPLFADGVILVATTADSVYALDPVTGVVRWRTHLANAVPLASLPCGNVDPLGILSTPVVDPETHRIFAVTEQSDGGIHHEMTGLDTRTGMVAVRQVVDPTGMNPIAQQQRSSLIIDQGRVIIAFGGLYGDCGDYHGWVVSASEDGTGPLRSYRTPGQGVAMWSTGGPVEDHQGNLYVSTGNGRSTSTYDQGESVLKLSPDLTLLDSFAVKEWAADNAADADLGSAGSILLGDSLLFQAGKRHTGYVLDTAHLGGIGGQRSSVPTGCASFGAQAYAADTLYVTCLDGGIHAFSVDVATGTLSRKWVSAGPGNGPAVVAGGAVWSEDWKAGMLHAYDPKDGHALATFPTGAADHFVSPAIAGDEVVVAAKRRVKSFARITSPAHAGP
ncbi:MAG: hypothetical protein NVS3B21_35360 [Acidimicrobiales bacterium]